MKKPIAVIGAGYVGMQVAYSFAKSGIEVIAYDNNQKRIEDLLKGRDKDGELSEFNTLPIYFTYSPQDLIKARYFIITVPTPVNEHRVPDLKPLKDAAKLVGQYLKKGDVVVLESTVFPGATEDLLIPFLKQESGLENGIDFFVGYSPERVIPGDRSHGLEQTIKVISGENSIALKKIKHLYQKGLTKQLHEAPTIKSAESCKLLENIQRDVNIALMNEYAQIMSKMDVSMHAVLEAAKTKFNFLPFQPGLVGGHCIPIDPYYLIYQAQYFNAPSELIHTARNVNETFISFILDTLVRLLNAQGIATKNAKVVILGISFKPNVPDTRHSLSVSLYKALETYNIEAYALDPIADKTHLELRWANWKTLPKCDAMVLAQPHTIFIEKGYRALQNKLTKNAVFMDIPGVFLKENTSSRKVLYWSL